MAPAPRRTYGLRTLFVLLTVCACGLGWELAAVRRRAAALVQLREKGVVAVARRDSRSFRRRWLGDVDIASFEMPLRVFDEVHPELVRLFPESDEAQYDERYRQRTRATNSPE